MAEILVRTGAVSFRTSPFFTFTSGVESPVYIDNRRLLGFVDDRRQIVRELAETAVHAPISTVDAVAGTATAGIPWAAWLAERLDLPMLYVRSAPKEWGHQRSVEGVAPRGARVLLLEDLAFTGASLIAGATNLAADGYRVAHCLTIVTYDLPRARRRFEELDVSHTSLTAVDVALDVAARTQHLAGAAVKVVSEWLAHQRSDVATSGQESLGIAVG